MKISYDSEELIKELKQDIAEFGGQTILAAWVKNIGGTEIITNYDFTGTEIPIAEDELKPGERIIFIQADLLLEKLIEQNKIF